MPTISGIISDSPWVIVTCSDLFRVFTGDTLALTVKYSDGRQDTRCIYVTTKSTMHALLAQHCEIQEV